MQLLEGRGADFTGTAGSTVEDSGRLVYVSGAVVEPGVYEVQPGDRIQDVLTAAGGPSADADLTRLNLAAYLADGQQIHDGFELHASIAVAPDGTLIVASTSQAIYAIGDGS